MKRVYPILVALTVVLGGCHWFLALSEPSEAEDGASSNEKSPVAEASADWAPPDLPGPCNDGLRCTVDAPRERGCTHAILPGFCLVDGQCFTDGVSNPQNLCQMCSTSKTRTAWTSDNILCDDKVACTHSDRCSAGACNGTSYNCTDTVVTHTCLQDTCTGHAPPPHGCALKADRCLIDDTCMVTGETNPLDPCLVCNPPASGYSWSPAAGCVSTLAGSTANNVVDHFGVLAHLSSPWGLAMDGSTLLVTEVSGHCVRRVTRGHVVTVAGCG